MPKFPVMDLEFWQKQWRPIFHIRSNVQCFSFAGKKRRSVLKRLHEKQIEVARKEGKRPQQELSQVMQEQEIE